eukprot:gene10702-11660_t
MTCLDPFVYEFLKFFTKGKVNKNEKEKNTVLYFYQELHVILILAFIGGYIDAAGYIKCNELFTSSITGNLVAACSSVYVTDGVVARVCVSLSFIIAGIAGFFLASKLKLANEWKKKPISAFLYLLEVTLLVIAFAVGLNYDQEMEEQNQSLSDWRLILTASIMGAAMGMHNAAAKESIPNVPATTVMTMTLVSESMTLSQLLAFFLADHLCLRLSPKGKQITDEDRKKNHEKLIDALGKWITVTRPLIAFLIGAVIGCALATNITYYCLLIPAVMIGTVVIDIYLAMVVERSVMHTADIEKADGEKGPQKMDAERKEEREVISALQSSNKA